MRSRRPAKSSRVRTRDTGPERIVEAWLLETRQPFTKQAGLPGKPDFYLPLKALVVFVDGDFWHGWDFRTLRSRLRPRWVTRIETNMRQDRKVERQLGRMRIKILRLWEHDVRSGKARLMLVRALLGSHLGAFDRGVARMRPETQTPPQNRSNGK